jgi:DNA-binding XRE family transcriptional regulator
MDGQPMTPAEKLAATRPLKRRSKTGHVGPLRCNIRALRESLGLSLDEVVAAVELSKTAIWEAEHGGNVTLVTARKLAAFYGKAIEELWPL